MLNSLKRTILCSECKCPRHVGKLLSSKEVVSSDEYGNSYTFRRVLIVNESNNPQIDQNLSADDLKLSNLLDLGVNLSSISSPYFTPSFDDASILVDALSNVNPSDFYKTIESSDNSSTSSSGDSQD